MNPTYKKRRKKEEEKDTENEGRRKMRPGIKKGENTGENHEANAERQSTGPSKAQKASPQRETGKHERASSSPRPFGMCRVSGHGQLCVAAVKM